MQLIYTRADVLDLEADAARFKLVRQRLERLYKEMNNAMCDGYWLRELDDLIGIANGVD